jgi:hypothetical protein
MGEHCTGSPHANDHSRIIKIKPAKTQQFQNFNTSTTSNTSYFQTPLNPKHQDFQKPKLTNNPRIKISKIQIPTKIKTFKKPKKQKPKHVCTQNTYVCFHKSKKLKEYKITKFQKS